MKENFYVFIDIYGTMWDIESALNSFILDSYSYFRQPSMKSIDALNFLIEELEKEYNVKLIITSTLKKFSTNYYKIMKEFGLKYSGEIEITSVDMPKAEAIADYIKDKENFNNVVILEDLPRQILKYFKKESIIKTQIINGGLDKEKVENFLLKLKNAQFDDSVEQIGLLVEQEYVL